jgi:hypothetical protein
VNEFGGDAEPRNVMLRSFGAVALATPSLLLVSVLAWIVLDLVVAWALRDAWSSTAQLVSLDDLWKIDDAFRLGVIGTRDALWARGSNAVSSAFADVQWLARVVLGVWTAVTAFAQTYFSIAVSRRAGDELPHRSNLLHALRRSPRVAMAWAVVAGTSGLLVFGSAWLTEGWTWWVAVPIQLLAQVVVVWIVTRTSFVVAIAVTEDELTLGLGWVQCLAMSWGEVRGRTFSVFLRLFLIVILPLGLVAGALNAVAFAEGVTGAGVGLAIATELTLLTIGVTIFVGAGSALYVVDYRHD